MEPINEFRKKIKNGHVCIGPSITLSDPIIAHMLGGSTSDFIWIEMEHLYMNPDILSGHLMAARARNLPSFVRVVDSSVHTIKPIVDMGADGIVVPQIRTASEVREIVENCKYPPLGIRGFGPRITFDYGRMDVNDYMKNANNNIFITAMIENAEAYENLDEILNVDGIDSILIGPMDLSCSFGFWGDFDHPKVSKAVDDIIQKTLRKGLIIGMGLPPDADYACKVIKKGVQWIQQGCDFTYLVNYYDQMIKKIRDDCL